MRWQWPAAGASLVAGAALFGPFVTIHVDHGSSSKGVLALGAVVAACIAVAVGFGFWGTRLFQKDRAYERRMRQTVSNLQSLAIEGQRLLDTYTRDTPSVAVADSLQQVSEWTACLTDYVNREMPALASFLTTGHDVDKATIVWRERAMMYLARIQGLIDRLEKSNRGSGILRE